MKTITFPFVDGSEVNYVTDSRINVERVIKAIKRFSPAKPDANVTWDLSPREKQFFRMCVADMQMKTNAYSAKLKAEKALKDEAEMAAIAAEVAAGKSEIVEEQIDGNSGQGVISDDSGPGSVVAAPADIPPTAGG